ncbi:hypothetical protein WG954_17650 [Lacibacter sp. H375]|uniref:hypothetical protein n=1 Tax=Lacibacter sp. H375 TaxID=3133424 RepID=UPI0030C5B250
MKKIFLPLVALALLTVSESLAQKKKSAAVSGLIGNEATKDEKNVGNKELKIISAEKVMDMAIPEGGANGASVAYNPKEKLYYAAQAGNAEFPLVIFNANGKVVSAEDQKTLIDVRGLWYNPKTKKLEGNAYQEFGWFSYELNKDGLPEQLNKKKEGLYQPDQNSAGVLNTEDNEVLFLDGLNIVCYSTDGTDKRKSIQLHFGAINANDAATLSLADFEKTYNTSSIIYTGMKGAEIGLLNITKKEIELYNIKSGYLSIVIKLPVRFELETRFNFSYSNGIYWVFDKQNRKWNGFR